MRKLLLLSSFFLLIKLPLALGQYTGGAYDGFGVASSGLLNEMVVTNTLSDNCPGNIINIDFVVSDYPLVNLYYSSSGGTDYTLIESGINASAGTYAWQIPSDALESSQYKIKLAAESNLDTFVESNAFAVNILEADFGGYAAVYYESAELIKLLPNVAGGTFSGTGIVNGNQFDPAIAGIGLHEITYALTLNGCTSTITKTIEVIADNPSVTSSIYAGGAYDGFSMANSAIINPFTIDQTLVGTCPGSVLSVAYNGGAFSNVDFLYTIDGGIQYTMIASDVGASSSTYDWSIPIDILSSENFKIRMQVSADTTIFVNSNAFSIEILTADFGGLTATYYLNNGDMTLLGSPSGGTFSGPGITGNIFDPAVAGIGTHQISYDYSDGACSAVTVTKEVTVIADNAAARAAIYQGGAYDGFSASSASITKIPLTVSIDVSREYGATEENVSYNFSGFVDADDQSVLNMLPSFTTETTISSEVGTYTTSTIEGADDKYYYVYEAGTYTISKKPLLVTAEAAEKQYGDTNPNFQLSYAGFVGEEGAAVLDVAPSVTTIADETSGVGTYDLVPSAGSDNNYSFSYESASLTINPKLLQVLAEDKTIIYGDLIPELTYSITGFVTGEDDTNLTIQPSLGTVATGTSDAGIYDITIDGALADNYTFNYVNANLQITKANQTIDFGVIEDQLITVNELNLEATATSNLEVSFTLESGPATLIGNVLQLNGLGTIILSANQSGGVNYNAASSIVRTFEILPACTEQTWYADADGDGFGDASTTLSQCEQPTGYVADNSDCDDNDANANPETIWYVDADGDGFGDANTTLSQCEQPTGYVADNSDCDDSDTNANPETIWYADADGDGFGDANTVLSQCEQPTGYVANNSDCDDNDANANPETIWYADADGDGFGDANITLSQCEQPTGYVADNSDCDDNDANANPETIWYADADGDGFGDANITLSQCEQPTGYVADNSDCDDNDANANPETIWYADADGDGFGDANSTLSQCEQPTAYVANSSDCDDNDANTNPETIWYADADGDGFGDVNTALSQCEQPNGYVADNSDCDDNDANANPETIWYADADGDGFGDANTTLSQCEQPTGYVADNSDCDDNDANANPETIWYADADGDGFGDANTPLSQCEQPTGYVANNSDCDDENAEANPETIWYGDGDGDGFGNSSISVVQCTAPDGFVTNDSDCDDNDVNANPETIWYADADGDGFGDANTTLAQCEQPTGYVADNSDCDDENAETNPETIWYGDGDGDGFGNSSISVVQCIAPDGFVTNDSDCDDTDDSILDDCILSANNSHKIKVEIYPNPTSGQVSISSSKAIKSISIISENGQLLQKTDYHENGTKTISLHLTRHKKSIILIRVVYFDDSFSVERIIVKN